MEALKTEITNAQSVRNTLEINEKDIDRFVKRVKYIIEHPSELLLKPENVRQQAALFSLVFEVLPTYAELKNFEDKKEFGTPKLAWVFDISTADSADSMLVRPPGIEPGTFSLKGSCSTS